MKLLGTIQGVFRYPVKSMAGQAQSSAVMGWHGLVGDRRFAFRKIGDPSGFPFLTAGKHPELLRYRPSYPAGADDGPVVRVVTPAGSDVVADSVELTGELMAASGRALELLHFKHGIFDDAPISVITLATMRRLSAVSGVALDVRRFRPNIVIDTPEDVAFAENDWVGRSLSFGGKPTSAVAGVTMLDLRCVMLNLDPDTAASDPRLLKATAKENNAFAGVYAVPVRTGTVHVGDELYALS